MAIPTHDARLAVLIDADNASADHLDAMMVEIAKYGTATVRRAYGDWASSRLKKWREVLVKHSLQPIQQFAHTSNKNATDIALVIDAMDLLHGGTVDGFFLVSSDSDFTRLAARIREQGLMAYGLGKMQTPEPFRTACSKFIYEENLTSADDEPQQAVTAKAKTTKPAPASASTAAPTKAKLTLQDDAKLSELLEQAVDAAADDDGWAHLGAVGSKLSRLASDFDSRTWGYAKLTELLKAHPGYDLESRSPGDGKPRVSVVRRKARK